MSGLSAVLSLLVVLSLSVTVSSQPYTYVPFVGMFNAPTTVPQTGYLSALVDWSSNCSGSANLHLDMNANVSPWGYDGGQTVAVSTPGSGVQQFVLSGFNGLVLGPYYQLHAYMACAAASLANGGAGYDYEISPVDFYQQVSAVAVPSTPSFSLINVPSTIPNNGSFTVDAMYSSPFAGYTMLHCDLSDLTLGWQFDGGSAVNVSTPGSGVVQLTLTVQNGPIPLADSFDLHLYLTAGVNTTKYGSSADWEHEALDVYYQVTSATLLSFGNSLTVVSTSYSPNAAPTVIPLSGTFTAYLAWSTNQVGLINLHVDISDISRNYFWDGGSTVQVMGPGAGLSPLLMQYNAFSTGALAYYNDSYELHTYMTLNNYTELYGSGVDWEHTFYNGYFPVNASAISSSSGSNYINILYPYPSIVTIPPTGTFDVNVRWSSNIVGGTVFHCDLSDVTTGWTYDTGATTTVDSTPGYGDFVMTLTISGTLNIGDLWDLHCYMTSLANHTLYDGADWQHTVYDGYNTVVVSNTPLTSQIVVINPPSAIPSTAGFTLDVYYTSALATDTFLHCDLSDVTTGWTWMTGATPVEVVSPGLGYVQLLIPALTTPVNTSHSFCLHTYMASLANETQYGSGDDWAHTPYNGYFFVSAASSLTFANSLVPISPPTTVPTSGNFTVQMAWSCNSSSGQLGVDLHVDLSDVTTGWTYEGGSFAEAACPGSGVLPFTIQILTNLTLGNVFSLHAYMQTGAIGLSQGTSNDWVNSLFNGYTTVQAAPPGTLVNSLAFVDPPFLIPTSGILTTTVAYASPISGGLNIHVDLSDVTTGWTFVAGSMSVGVSPGTGTVSPVMTLPAGLNLSYTSVYELHAYMASTANSSANGGTGNDWEIALANAYVVVSPVPVTGFVNSMVIVNPPSNMTNYGSETFQVLWETSFVGLMNLHLDVSDVTLNWLYGGGSIVQVTGPGSGTALMTVAFNENGTSQLKMGDAFSLHAYMASNANSTLYGGTSNDWEHACFNGYWTVTVALNSSFANQMALVSPFLTIPATGFVGAQVVWSSNIPVETDLHMDLSDVTLNYTYEGGSSTVVTSPAAGIVTLNVSITVASGGTALNAGNQYTLHLYMASTANGTKYGTGDDWEYAVFNAYYPVTVAGSSGSSSVSSSSSSTSSAPSVSSSAPSVSSSAPSVSSSASRSPASSSSASAAPTVPSVSSSSGSINGGGSSSSSSLSGGAIAGIVIGCVVGAGLCLALLVFCLCGVGRSSKRTKQDAAHQRHTDESSVRGEPSQAVEMGEVQT